MVYSPTDEAIMRRASRANSIQIQRDASHIGGRWLFPGDQSAFSGSQE